MMPPIYFCMFNRFILVCWSTMFTLKDSGTKAAPLIVLLPGFTTKEEAAIPFYMFELFWFRSLSRLYGLILPLCS